jgi:hypothetical protein
VRLVFGAPIALRGVLFSEWENWRAGGTRGLFELSLRVGMVAGLLVRDAIRVLSREGETSVRYVLSLRLQLFRE